MQLDKGSIVQLLEGAKRAKCACTFKISARALSLKWIVTRQYSTEYVC